MSDTRISRRAALAALAMAAAPAVSLASSISLSQDFTSDPASAGWTAVNTVQGTQQNYGWSSLTNNAGGVAGEAGGTIGKAPLTSYFADTSFGEFFRGDIATVASNTYVTVATGKIGLGVGTGRTGGLYIGYFDQYDAAFTERTPEALGVLINDPVSDKWRVANSMITESSSTGYSSTAYQPSSLAPTSFSFQLQLRKPTNATYQSRLIWTSGASTGSMTSNASPAERGEAWNAFGIVCFSSDGTDTPAPYYIDDLTYTASSRINWNMDSDGSWTTGSNWVGGIAPNDPNWNADNNADGNGDLGAGAVAEFGSIATAPRTITLDSAVEAGVVRFDNANSYTISGTASLTLGGLAPRIKTINGSHTVDVPVILRRSTDFDATAGNTLTISDVIDSATYSRPVTDFVDKTGRGTVVITDAQTFPQQVQVSAGTLQFDGAVTTAGTLSAGGSRATSTGTMVFNNNLTVNAGSIQTVVRGGHLILNGTSTLNTLIVGATGNTSANPQHDGTVTAGPLTTMGNLVINRGVVNVSTGDVFRVNDGTAGSTGLTVKTNTAAIPPENGKIDLNGVLIHDYVTGTTGTPLASLKSLIILGYNGGAWNGLGITSSSALASGLTGLGYAEASVVAPGGTFAGQTVDADAAIVKYTYKGDTNLDGQVTIADLGDLASNWQSTTAEWISGDFNYDGQVTIADLGDLASNWQAGVGNPLGMSFQQALAAVGLGNVEVPEPASLGLIGVGLMSLMSRRRR